LVFELPLLGLTIGFISGLLGVGGGTLLVPALLYVGYAIKDAIGISVIQMVFSSVFGSYLNYKRGSLPVRNGLFLGLGGLTGAQGSGLMVTLFSPLVLSNIFLFSVCFAIYKFFRTIPQSDKPEINSNIILFIVGFFVGLIAISIGLGGGLYLIPILVGFMNYDIKKAISMSLFFIVFSSISGFISLSSFGHVDYKVGLIVGVSSLVGVFFGIKSAHIIDKKLQKKLLLGLYVVILFLTINKLYV
jgi:hypothetical protein